MGHAGIGERELAETIGITASKMAASMGGTRRFSTYELAAIAEHFTTTVEYLVSGKEPRRPRVLVCRWDEGSHGLTSAE